MKRAHGSVAEPISWQPTRSPSSKKYQENNPLKTCHLGQDQGARPDMNTLGEG